MTQAWHLFGPDATHKTLDAVIAEALQFWADRYGGSPAEIRVKAGSATTYPVTVGAVPADYCLIGPIVKPLTQEELPFEH